MKCAVIQFPGSNCDTDCQHVASAVCGEGAVRVWHKESLLPTVDAVIVPGGFSYGDYLRAGAIAAQSPIMNAVKAYAKDGGLVLGICNGFQILTECGLLPGTLLRNRTLKFECRSVPIRVEHRKSAFTRAIDDDVIAMPIAHMDGCYYADDATLQGLRDHEQVLFRYTENPNGSCDDIAGIVNRAGNVLGMMPHPERIADAVLGSCAGTGIFESMRVSRS